MKEAHVINRATGGLQASLDACVEGLISFLLDGTYDGLVAYSEAVCDRGAKQGLDISALIEGHLMASDALSEILQQELQLQPDGEEALRLAATLDPALRWLAVSLGRRYSALLNTEAVAQRDLIEKQQKQLDRRAREVTALVRSSELITSTLDIEQLLALILQQLAEVVSYDRAAIQLVVENKLRIIAGNGFLRPDRVLGRTFDPDENDLTRRILEGEAPVVLKDVAQEPAFVDDPGDPTGSWIGVPLRVRDTVIGALAIDKIDAEFYDDEDGQTVLAFANQAAIAIENARLHDKAREQDILQERNRLARELHDSLSQSLFSMVLNAEAAILFFDDNLDKARNQLQLLYETANSALKEMRALIFELRPADLEQEGLAAVLAKHGRMISDRHGIKVHADVMGQRRLSLQIEKALFRVAQEALNNVVKHAKASEAWVRLSSNERTVTLTVEDNGVGLSGDSIKPGTLGLTSMRERVEQLSGNLEIRSRGDERGTLVRATVPCA